MPLRDWLQLALTEGIGPILSRRLIERAGDVEAACRADAKILREVDGIGAAKAAKIQQAIREAGAQVDAELARAAAANVRIICPDDGDDYPVLLRSIPDPPVVLYVRGTLEPRDLNSIGIVGSRRCSYYGREQAERFASLLAGSGFTVISGGARGVDSAAHRGAMAQPQGRTIAVLGSGVDTPYPPENAGLFDLIARRGAVVSEFPLGTPPNKENFPRRNRIVSGMSRGVMVVEADVRSGALITARQAVEDHGRPVFAVPGRVDNPQSAGPHKLIREGAVLTTCLEDVLHGLDPLPHDAVEPSLFAPSLAEMIEDPAVPDNDAEEGDSHATAAEAGSPLAAIEPAPATSTDHDHLAGLSDRQRSILLEMGNDPAAIDLLIERTALPAQVVLQELTFLSLKGRVKRVDGQTYVRHRAGPRA
jgi:DNA processing protein